MRSSEVSLYIELGLKCLELGLKYVEMGLKFLELGLKYLGLGLQCVKLGLPCASNRLTQDVLMHKLGTLIYQIIAKSCQQIVAHRQEFVSFAL